MGGFFGGLGSNHRPVGLKSGAVLSEIWTVESYQPCLERELESI